jgi:hypothetical protein
MAILHLLLLPCYADANAMHMPCMVHARSSALAMALGGI